MLTLITRGSVFKRTMIVHPRSDQSRLAKWFSLFLSSEGEMSLRGICVQCDSWFGLSLTISCPWLEGHVLSVIEGVLIREYSKEKLVSKCVWRGDWSFNLRREPFVMEGTWHIDKEDTGMSCILEVTWGASNVDKECRWWQFCFGEVVPKMHKETCENIESKVNSQGK